jgi:hypothetical protein
MAQIEIQNLPSGDLHMAAKQWASRPADERFESLEALAAATQSHRLAAREKDVAVGDLCIEAKGEEVMIAGAARSFVPMSHYGFGHLSSRLAAPASYLRKLPADLAARCLQNGLASAQKSDRESGETTKLALLFRGGDSQAQRGLQLRAALTESYERIWDSEVAARLVRFVSENPGWGFPESFRKANGLDGSVQKVAHAWGESKTLPVAFASDHDMFVFLCDYSRGIEVGGSVLARGFIVENSEVGASALKITSFLFDFACCNVIIWGAKQVKQISIRHVGSAREKALADFGDAQSHLRALAEASPSHEVEVISRAQKLLLGANADEVVSNLFARRIPGLAKSDVVEAIEVAEATPRYGNPLSVWGVVQGLTEVSQKKDHADARMELDRAAGRVLEAAF